MNVLITDDEKYMCEELSEAMDRVSPGATYHFAKDHDSAIEVIEQNKIDIAFLDINMPGPSGMEIAKKIKKISPETNIIIVTAYEEYALQALRLFVSGYLMKPVIDTELAEVLDNLRTPPTREDKNSIKVRCFGNFEVFHDGKPISFSRQKAKELLAYLICMKGSSANRSEICANLFEEQFEDKAIVYLRKIVQSLKKDLEAVGLDDLFIHNRNSYSVNVDMLDCDYYNYLSGKDDSEEYHGEFMSQYSWAEYYIYELENY